MSVTRSYMAILLLFLLVTAFVFAVWLTRYHTGVPKLRNQLPLREWGNRSVTKLLNSDGAPSTAAACPRPAAISSEASTSLDAKIHDAFTSLGIASPRDIVNLSLSQRSELEKRAGVDFSAAFRAFTLYHGYLSSYNRCYYRFLRNPRPCDAADVLAVIVVYTLPASKKQRMSIRQRLVGSMPGGFRLVFLVGRSEAAYEDELIKEADLNKDVIWADFQEDYYNLTIKTVMMVRWAAMSCSSARYIVKVDGDVYVNIANLHSLLATDINRRRTIMGQVSYNDGVFRDMSYKWYMPSYMYSKGTYPPFAHGPCYVFTTDLLSDINRVSATMTYIHLEDIYLAMCTSMLENVYHVDVPQFVVQDCSIKTAIAFHGLTCSG